MKNLLKKMTLKTLTILCVFITINSYSQYAIDWEKNYGGNNFDEAVKILNTDDGGYLMTGYSSSNSDDFVNGFIDRIWLVKINQFGIIEWKKGYGNNLENNSISNIEKTSDGGYVLSCSKGVNPNYRDFWVVKIDSIGNIEWENTFGGSDDDFTSKVIELSDGTYMAVGSTKSTDGDITVSYNGINPAYDYWIVNMDHNGNFLWEKSYGGSNGDILNNVIETNNGLMLFGSTRSSDYNVSNYYGSQDVWIVKIDFTGNIIWEKNYGGSSQEKVEHFNSFIKAKDGGFYFTTPTKSLNFDVSVSHGNFDFWLVKIDSLGTILWENSYGTLIKEYSECLIEKSNGNILVAGFDLSFFSGAYLIETDSLGQLISKNNFGGSGSDRIYSITLDNNENPVLFGYSSSDDMDVSNNYGFNDWWLVKLRPFTARVYGSVVLDRNENCVLDNTDELLNNVIIKANNINSSYASFYSTTNPDEYEIYLDSVDHYISVVSPSPYFSTSSCSQDTLIAHLNSQNLLDTVIFYLKPLFNCPYLEVDITAPFLRRCDSTNFVVSYCNNGTDSAYSAYVEVEIDPTFVVYSSSIPWSSINGNLYTFPIGDVAMFDCGNFTISVSLPCDSTTFLGQILCAEAHIYPDTFCLPAPTWSGAELQAKAECIGTDTVEFTLKNIGAGNMTVDVPIIAIEDVILIMDSLDHIDSGNEIKWRFPTNGISTHRIIAQQPSNHPYKTFTTDAIANCNLVASVGPPPSQDSAFLAYPNDEEAPFIAIDCQPIIGSFDPNDKTVYPIGVGANHYVSENTDLEYKIRFQNTGTDTAFLVVITDSISNLLDVTSIHPGASSHSYQFDIFGTGVVRFTFNNILLPDSFVDESASHGFVQYKIKQKIGNQVGNVILNNADIFFDYNLPIRTNTAFSEIGGIFLDTIIYKFPAEPETPEAIADLENFNIKVYPNPAKDYMYFEFENKMKNVSIELFDLAGKLQQKTIVVNSNKLKIERNNLSSGMYLFKIYSEEKELAYGKLNFK